MGNDNRFKFAIPVYGCGYLPGSDGVQGDGIKPGQQEEIVNKYWDGSAYFSNVTIPTLWVVGTNDKHFPLPSVQKSSQSVNALAILRFQEGMKHGHYPGWAPEEIYSFANSIVNEGDKLLQFDIPKITGSQASVSITASVGVREAELLFTKDSGVWLERKWEKLPAKISGASISASIPPGCTTLFFAAKDENDLMVSSAYILIK